MKRYDQLTETEKFDFAMNRNSPMFESACQNTASFIWGSRRPRTADEKLELWNSLTEETKNHIRDFVSLDLRRTGGATTVIQRDGINESYPLNIIHEA